MEYEGNSKNVDLDSDGKYDVLLELNKINSIPRSVRRADISIRGLK